MERAPQQAAAGSPADTSAGHDPLIMSVDGLTKKYAGVAAVDHVSIGFASGSITGIVGPNGAGKTTLFGLISGTVKADEGSISYLGREIRRLSPRARARIGIARTFQTARFFTSLTVRQNLLIAVPRGAASRPSWFRSRSGSARTAPAWWGRPRSKAAWPTCWSPGRRAAAGPAQAPGPGHRPAAAAAIAAAGRAHRRSRDRRHRVHRGGAAGSQGAQCRRGHPHHLARRRPDLPHRRPADGHGAGQADRLRCHRAGGQGPRRPAGLPRGSRS